MTTRPPRRHRDVLRLGALLAAAAMMLAGCAIPIPSVVADPAPEGPQPALDQPRLDRVIAEITDALATADADGDASELKGRVTGPARHTRTAEYRLQEATARTDDPTSLQQLTLDPDQVVMDNSDSWPKTVFVVTTIADGMNTPLLVGLQQDDPRADYRMFAWVRLLPDTTTPATAIAAEGSAAVAPDAEGLVLSPEETVSAYADVLENGDDSDDADTFASDYFREAVLKDREAIQDSVSEAGEYSETYTLRQFEPVSLATADGGAIVIGALRGEQQYELTEEGGELTVSTPDLVALAGEDDAIDVEDTLTATYYVTVAFYVPPASDDATIQVLGAERVLDDVDTGASSDE